MKRILSLILILSGILPSVVYAEYSNEELKLIQDSVDERVENIVRFADANPFPNPDTTPTKDIYIGKISDAFVKYYLNKDIDKAAKYLNEVCRESNYGIPHTGDYSTYFQMSIMVRLWYWFNENSLYYPGRLSKESEADVLHYIWEFVNPTSNIEEAKLVNLDEYYLYGSGNHHVIKRTAWLLGTQILKEHPDYKDRTLMDGHTVKEHYDAWNEYWKNDIVQRSKVGMEIEYASNGYYKYTMDCFFTLREFAESSVLRELAQKYLDVIFSDIAIQSNNGLYGGARGRSTRNSNADVPVETIMFAKWFNEQSAWRIPDSTNPLTGEKMLDLYPDAVPMSNFHPNMVSAAISSYYPPQIVADLVTNEAKRGKFEYYSRTIGKGYRDPDRSGFFIHNPQSDYLRYSYVTPYYVVGTSTLQRGNEYSDVCQQNRQYGISFAVKKQTNQLSRVFPESETTSSRGYHDLNGLAHKNTLIMQSLPEARYCDPATHADIFIVFTPDIWQTHEIIDGWIFGYVPDGNGYVAVRPSKGKIKKIEPYSKNKSHMGVYFTQRYMPIIMQAGCKEEYGSYENFKKLVLNTHMQWNSKTEFEYTSLDGTSMKVYTDFELARVNDEEVDLNPEYMYYSPYFKGVYGSGIFELTNTKGEKNTIEFSYDDSMEVGITKMESHEYLPDWNVNKLIVNGAYRYCQTPPEVTENGIYLPIREVFSAFGAEIAYDAEQKAAVVSQDGKKAVFPLFTNTAYVDGIEVALASVTKLSGDKIMINAEVLSECFNAKMKWDETNNTMVIWRGVQ